MRHLGKSVKSRLMQCPGCWAGGFVPQGGDYQECECGEKMTLVDLRGVPEVKPSRSPGKSAVTVEDDPQYEPNTALGRDAGWY